MDKRPSLIRYFFSVVAVLLCFSIVDIDKALSNIDVGLVDILSSLLFFLFLLILSGFRLRASVLYLSGVKTSASDILALPLVMTLWGYLLPLKGGMLYSIAYLKFRYHVNFAEGSAASVVTYLITLFVMGIVLLVIWGGSEETSLLILIAGLLLACILPLGLLVFLTFDKAHSQYSGNRTILSMIVTKLSQVAIKLIEALAEPKLLLILVFWSVLHMVVMVWWFSYLSDVLGFGLTPLALILMLCANQLMLIVRFVPGGLGITELGMTSAVGLVGESVEEAFVLAALVRVSGLALTFSLGVWLAQTQVQYFKVSSFKELIRSNFRIHN